MAIKYSGNKYNSSGGGPSYMKGYSGKGGRNGRKKNNFVPIIVVIILIIIAIFAYFSIGSDNDKLNSGDNSVATAEPTAKPTAKPTEEPEEDLYSTPSPTLAADDTVDSYTLENVPTAKPKATEKPKPTTAPTVKPDPTAVPTNIPSSSYGTAYVNKYYTSGIYVRSGAGKENSVVLHIKKDDHTTRLVPTGNTQADNQGYTWIEVKIPSGAIGWVRSDVVAQQ